MKIRRYWLDSIFPDGPPQDYSRKGLEIGSTYIAISEQIIPAKDYDRSYRILWPSGVVNGLYLFWNTVFVFQWRRVKESLGMDTSMKPGTFEFKLDRMLKMLKAQENIDEQRGPETQPPISSSDSKDAESDVDLTPASKWYLNSLPALHGDNSERALATFGFLHAIMSDKKEERKEPPRGNFVVYGMLQATGARAYAMFDVVAFYDPKANSFTNIALKAKTVKTWKQAPRGGP